MTAQELQQKNKQDENDQVEDEREAEKERKEMLLKGINGDNPEETDPFFDPEASKN